MFSFHVQEPNPQNPKKQLESSRRDFFHLWRRRRRRIRKYVRQNPFFLFRISLSFSRLNRFCLDIFEKVGFTKTLASLKKKKKQLLRCFSCVWMYPESQLVWTCLVENSLILVWISSVENSVIKLLVMLLFFFSIFRKAILS